MIAGIKARIPRGSIRLTLFIFPGSIVFLAGASLKNRVMNMPVMTPRGMLM